ncbi:MAG: hypothetical protein OIF50_11425 [Flavobacteriaceae bacterium]|nr:hypothetical protein [Flavobacteriaceae bacterium]
MQLNKDQIRFIDNYLYNSGVEFLDIRMEMVDHIATALEQDIASNQSFYDAFKAYMIQHKASLLQNDKQFRKSARKKTWINLWNSMQTKTATGILLGVSILVFGLEALLDLSYYKNFLIAAPVGSLILSALLFGVMNKKHRKRFRLSAVEGVFWVYMILYQFIIFFFNPFGKPLLHEIPLLGIQILTVMIVFLSFVLFVSAHQSVQTFKQQLKTS